MSEAIGKSRGTVAAAGTALAQIALVVVLVVGVGWTLLKIAEWKENRRQPVDEKSGETTSSRPAPEQSGKAKTQLIRLTTPFALIHGEAKMVPDGENSHIDDWRRLDDWVEWRFHVESPGEYEVVVEYASKAADAGSGYTVTVNGQSLSGEVTFTGKNWIPDRVGRVNFDEPGDYTLAVKPQSKPATTLMRLKRIVLRGPA